MAPLHSGELELLEFLSGATEPFEYFEKFVFETRDHALRAHAIDEGLIVATIGDNPVEAWRIADWRRNLTQPDTEQALQNLQLAIADNVKRNSIA